jgi:hypothetical protein
MAGTFPTSPGFTSVETKLKHYQLKSESINGRIQVRSLNSSRREFRVEFPPMTKAAFDPIYEFVVAQEGMLETFSIAIPDPTTPGSNETVTVRMANDIQEFAIGVDGFYRFEIDLVEVI